MPSISLCHYVTRVSFIVLGLFFLTQFAYGSQTALKLDDEGSIAEEVLLAANNARMMKSCTSCQALLIPLKRLATIGDDQFVSTVTRICKARKLQDPEVCDGDIGSQGPIIANALRRISINGRTSRLFCNALFGMCDLVPVEPYQVDFPENFLEEPSPRREVASSRREPFQVVHVSDVHIDREYLVGSEANCTKYICCRDFSSDEEKSDKEVIHPAEPYGNHHCDSPIGLANSMLKAIRDLVPSARFTISSGDVVDHVNWLLTQDVVEEELHGFHEQLFVNLSSSNTFYGSIGNHDAYPTNDFPRTTSDEAEAADWIFELLGNDWERWIGTSGASSVQHASGSYSVVHPGTSLKLISINTQYWYKYNFWLYDSDDFQPDPNGILSFVVDELDAAEKAGQRAWIIGHIPPGTSDTMRDQSNYYNQVVQRYHATIAGQFYGHTHIDHFMVAYTNYSDRNAETAMSFGLIAPSLTPTNGNPAFTTYDVDPDTYEIMDAKVYIANMSKSSYNDQPEWQLYYSARDSYGPLVASLTTGSTKASYPATAPLDASFWHHLTKVFEADNATFTKYLERETRGAWIRQCDEKCRNVTICDMRAMRAEDSCFQQSLNEIVIPPPGQKVLSAENASEDALVAPPELAAHIACEGNAVPMIMRRLVAWANADINSL